MWEASFYVTNAWSLVSQMSSFWALNQSHPQKPDVGLSLSPILIHWVKTKISKFPFILCSHVAITSHPRTSYPSNVNRKMLTRVNFTRHEKHRFNALCPLVFALNSQNESHPLCLLKSLLQAPNFRNSIFVISLSLSLSLKGLVFTINGGLGSSDHSGGSVCAVKSRAFVSDSSQR